MTEILSAGAGADEAGPSPVTATAPVPEIFRWVKIANYRDRGKDFAAENLFGAAVEEFDAALRDCPTAAEIWFLRGSALLELGQLENAYNAFAQAVILTPIYPEARRSVAALGERLGKPAVLLTPWLDDPRPPMGARLRYKYRKYLGPKRSANLPSEEDLRVELVENPRLEIVAAELGRRLIRSGRYVEAECFLRYALALGPWSSQAATYLARIASYFKFYDESRAILIGAVDAGADSVALPGQIFWAGRTIGDWSDHDLWVGRTLKAMRREALAAEPLMALHVTDDPDLHKRASVAASAMYSKSILPVSGVFRRTADRPITIGYISADFRNHAVAHLVAELFELHDRTRFRVFGYSVFKAKPSEVGDRVRASFDKFEECAGLPAQVVAEKIKQDGVDILIDLTGHTESSPLPVLARRPAPIQVSYLGYPSTTGASFVDYMVVDKTIVPPDHEQYYTESLVYMPHCYQVNDRQRKVSADPPTREKLGIPASGFIFCCFNETRKISPDLFQVWMSILKRVPDSSLVLLEAQPKVMENLKREVAHAGVAPDRLVFTPRIGVADHLGRYRYCDLFLDTLFYNAHTTASDSIWSGCPILTMIGKTFPARVCASILRTVGLPELITTSLQEYEDLAVRVGLDPDMAENLKQKVRATRTSPLFDTPMFTRQLEWSYERMWDNYVEGRPAARIDVPA